MKICYLADAYSIHTQRWVKYFADKGHEVFLISYRQFGNNKIKNVKLYVLKEIQSKIWGISFIINLLFTSIQVRKIIKKINPDIIHAHFVTDNGLFGALSGFHPLVVTAWGSDILLRPQKTKNRYIARYVLKKADLVTCDSDKVKQAMIALNNKAENSYVIQWGVNLDKFNPSIDATAIKTRLNIDNAPAVISTRNFGVIYNIDTIIKAIPFVVKEIPDVKIILKNAYGTMEPELRNLAKELAVIESGIFVGMIDYDEMPTYLKASDVFISVPSSDSTSISLLEAMACELPVIVSDLPANREWVKDEWNGYIVPIRDEKALADAIVKLLKDEKKRKLFGRRNYELVKEKGDYEKNMEKMEELYGSLLG